jgi:isocitrate lyase
LEKDRDFVERLGTFNTQFTIEREQLSAMWDELKEKMASDEELD